MATEVKENKKYLFSFFLFLFIFFLIYFGYFYIKNDQGKETLLKELDSLAIKTTAKVKPVPPKVKLKIEKKKITASLKINPQLNTLKVAT